MVVNVNEQGFRDFSSLEAPVEPSERQQDKIVANFTRPEYEFPSENTFVGPSDREFFINKISGGQVSDQMTEEFLYNIKTPFEIRSSQGRGPEIIKELEEYPNYRQIQAIMLALTKPDLVESGNFRGWTEHRKKMGYKELMGVALKYPNPRELEKATEPFLKVMHSDYGSDKIQEYEKSLRVFERALFGKRYEYSEQFKLLEQEAIFNRWKTPPNSRENVSAPKAPEREPVAELIRSEGSIKRVLPLVEDPRLTRQAGLEDLKRVAPIKEILSNQHRVSYEITGGDSIHILSVPENPNISDKESAVVVEGIARKIVEVSKQSGEVLNAEGLKFKLLKVTGVDMGSAVPELGGERAFKTKNNVYRGVVSKVNDRAFFERMLRA